jgi:Mn2+/Fe2+ NRAMP family transporter
MAAMVLPISTAFSISEGLGWGAGLNKKFKEAKQFYLILISLIVISAGAILLPNLNLIKIMLFSQTINGMLLPVILVLMLIIINRESVMGKHVNSKTQNIITIITTAGVIVLTVSLILFTFLGR